MFNEIDVLVVGAGPAGLSAAIQLQKQLAAGNRRASVVVIDKAPKVGYHSLSGAVFEPACLDELLPGWRSDGIDFAARLLKQAVTGDSIHYLTSRRQVRVPGGLLPAGLKHHGDCTMSVGQLAQWLGAKAAAMGVEIYTGFTAGKAIIEDGAVRGVELRERGVDRDGKPCENYMPGEAIRAKVTVLADGVLSPLSLQVIRQMGLAGRNPQVYSLGLKQLIKLPRENRFGANRVVHTIGYPNKWDVFGGGFLYDMGDEHVALGLVLGLDWRYRDLNPQQELERFKAHPFLAGLLEGGEPVAAGARTIPEGGYYSMPTPFANGVLLVGDAAGLVNIRKLKGLHLAVRSGMAAGNAIAQCLGAGDFSAGALAAYARQLDANGVMREMRGARNMRQGFATPLGLFLGAPLSVVQQWMPLRLPIGEDRDKTRGASIHRTYRGAMDRKTFAGLTGTLHDEELRSHIRIPDARLCRQCIEEFGGPCMTFCPNEVYTLCQKDDDNAITVSSSDCMHCKTCMIKCPKNNIEWEAPEGGFGPKYRRM